MANVKFHSGEQAVSYTHLDVYKRQASWQLQLNELGPFVVDIDCDGNNLFEQNSAIVDANKEKVFKMLKIPQDFQYTKLY